MVTLEKIDKVVERTGVSFEIARNALDYCDGDVIDAIIYIQSKYKNIESKGVKSSEIIATLRGYIRRGNVSRIIIEKEDENEVILNLPLTVGAVGMILAPVVAIIGLGATVLNKITVKIVDSEGKIININKAASEAFSGLKKTGSCMKADKKEKMNAKKQGRDDASEEEEETCEDGSDEKVEFEKEEDMCEWREDQGYACDTKKKTEFHE